MSTMYHGGAPLPESEAHDVFKSGTLSSESSIILNADTIASSVTNLGYENSPNPEELSQAHMTVRNCLTSSPKNWSYSDWAEQNGPLVTSLVGFCTFQNTDQIRAFLNSHPTVPKLLHEAKPELDRFFGRSTRISLELLFDPEDTGGGPTLYATIRTGLPWEEAINRLYRFDDEWWLDASRRESAPLCITI